MEATKPGSILINTSTNKLYGVLVSVLPNNKIIVFRLDRNTHPIFSKFEIHPHIAKVGIINDHSYANLKNSLLKHYRTYNLTPTEKIMLKPLMEFAFPIGIPEYQPDIELPDRDIQLMDLHSRLVPGSRVFLNTPPKSCYSHLNGKTLDIIEKTDTGIWTNLPSNENDICNLGSSLNFLFYKNQEVPSFGGISRIVPITDDNTDTTKLPCVNEQLAEAFKELKQRDSLTTTIEYNGTKVRIIPNTRKVIFPEMFQNMEYNPKTDSFTIDPSLLTSMMSSKLGDKLVISSRDSHGNPISMIGTDNDIVFKSNNYLTDKNSPDINMSMNTDGDLDYKIVQNYNRDYTIRNDGYDGYDGYGGGRGDSINSKISNEDLLEIENDYILTSKYRDIHFKSKRSQSNIDDIDELDEDFNDTEEQMSKHIENLMNNDEEGNLSIMFSSSNSSSNTSSNSSSNTSSNTSSNSSSNTDDSLSTSKSYNETEYDEDNIAEIVESTDIEELGTFEKIRRVEVGELEKVYKESIQKGDLHKYKLEQLSLFERKDKIKELEIIKKINILSLFKHSLTDNENNIKFKSQDYKPLVDKYSKLDFTNKFLIPLVINRKKIYIEKNTHSHSDDYDKHTHEIIEDYYANIKHIIHIQDKKNISINNDSYTNNIITELNPTSITQTNNTGILFNIGSKIHSNNYEKIFQDTLTIKYCDKPMKCQSYSLNPMNFECQVNLGPIGRFVDEDEPYDNEPYDNEPYDNESYDNETYDNETYEKHIDKKHIDKKHIDKKHIDKKHIDKDKYKKDKNVRKHTINNESNENNDILYMNPKYITYYQGDQINLIGYVRPPLAYFNENNNILLSNLYAIQKQQKEVITVNLDDITNPELINEELEEQFSITQNPNKFILFLLPQTDINMNELTEHFDKLIPSIDDIIKLYFHSNQKVNKLSNPKDNKDNKHNKHNKHNKDNKHVKYTQSLSSNTLQNTSLMIENVYSILAKFGYEYRNITLDIYNKICNELDKTTTEYTEFNETIAIKFKAFQKEQKSMKLEIEKQYKHSKLYSKARTQEDKPKFRYITDDIMDDIGKFYFDTYENKGIYSDTDDMRLNWFMKRFDNGKYLFKTLFMNYLKMYQEKNNLENIETEFAIMKEKHAMSNIGIHGQNQNQVQGQIQSQGQGQCITKITGPNVIKYPNLERLEQDNGKVSTDSEGNVIMMGDYALVDVNKSKQLFKRETIGNTDMWIKETIEVLYKLIQDKKNKCIANPEIKLEDANKCMFDLEQLKCEPIDIMDMTKQVLDMELQLNNLQKEIDYIKHIPILIASLNKDIINERIVLVNKINSLKRFWKDKDEEEAKLEEYNSKLRFTNKPCIHYNVTKYFFNIKNDQDRYVFSQSIFKQFQNTEPEFMHNYNVFNSESRAHNYTYCNICNQELLCNHFRLGSSYLENTENINYENITNIYCDERNGTYYCKVDGCNEAVDTTEIIDIDDFGKGEDGFRIKTRELTDNTPFIEKQKKYIDNMIKTLLDEEQTIKTEELLQKINIFKLMKRLASIENLSIKDEIEFLNFLKSYQFESKTKILKSITVASPKLINNIPLLKKTIDNFYLRYLITDIGSRFLITLQTSSTNYLNQSSNKDCIPNIIGYPLINSLDALDGINYIMCIFYQIAILPEYGILAELQQKQFIDRITKQVNEDNFIKDKIHTAINNKSTDIDKTYEFNSYYTNIWKEFAPRLDTISTLNWSPEKLLSLSNLKEVTYKTMGKMLDVGRENSVYYSLCLMGKINDIIATADKSNNKGLLNSCCLDSYNSINPYNYLDFFRKQSSDINKYMTYFIDIQTVLKKLNEKQRWSILNIIYSPIYKPSQQKFDINFNVNANEIKDIYLKFIDNGLHKGKQHIYDKYKRCILSNEKYNDIAMKTYSTHDYKRIESAIHSGNQIDISKYSDITESSIIEIELKAIDSLIDICPKIDILKFILDYLTKIKESAHTIFSIHTLDTKQQHTSQTQTQKNITKQIYKHTRQEAFDINRHLSLLNSQIENEILGLVKNITIKEKDINKYTKIMTNLGDFKKLYNEYKHNAFETENLIYNLQSLQSQNSPDARIQSTSSANLHIEQTINVKSNLYRYNKKEEHIQYTIKFLNDIINQIKNRQLSNPLNKEHIRPHYRDFLKFGENDKLFKMLGATTRQIYNFTRCIKSKHKYKVLHPEMVSSICQYLNIISLVNLFNILDISKLNVKSQNELIDYKFREYEEPAESLKDLNRELYLDLDENVGLDNIYNTDDNEYIESFELKKSNNLNIISGFITTYLDKINDIQTTYDELTTEKINTIVTTHDQKLRDANLQGFKWLSTEGQEDARQFVFLKMHKLKKLDYADISKYLKLEYGSNYDNENNNDIDSLEADANMYFTHNENIAHNDEYSTEHIDEFADYEDELIERDQYIERDAYIDTNEYKNRLNKEELAEMPDIYDEEDNEDADQDYDYLATGDGDD